MTELNNTEKLQKVLAAQGLGSRRGMELWIAEGRIKVNGIKASLGDRVSIRDKISVDNQPINRTEHTENIKFLQYNKPEGEICSRDDPKGRPTVFDNLPVLISGRWLSVGRLDLNTSGLLLFTNNGELANKLMHPSTGVIRRYMARVRGKLNDDELKTIVGKGVLLDGKPAKFHDVVVVDREDNGTNHWLEVGIEEGRNREVRRIFESLGHPVSRLKRISYGNVQLMPNVRKGHAKEMAPLQVEKMLKLLGLDEFVPKVRLHKDDKKVQKNSPSRSQFVKGSKEAIAKSVSDKLSFKENKDRKKKTREQRANEWSSEKPNASNKRSRSTTTKKRSKSSRKPKQAKRQTGG
jgi:23S rRNA pseudouridine2605 synthase